MTAARSRWAPILVALAPSVAVLSPGRAVIGTALGFLGTGTPGSEAGWRWGFAALAVVGGLVAAAAWWLPEPTRGGQRTSEDPGAEGTLAHRVREQGIRPNPSARPGAPPATMGLRAAVGYVLRVRSNRVLIVVSALTYVLHHDAWGRAESVRSVLRLVAYAVAPVLLGTLIGVLGTGPAFAVATAALALAGGIVVFAVRSYPGDVAAAAEDLPAEDLPVEDRRSAG